MFAGSKIGTPRQMPYAEHVYHLYIVVVEDREALRKALSDQGIENGLHYPVPLHLQKAYADLGYKRGDFPVSEHVAENHVSLPMYAELPVEHAEHVAKTVLEILECQPITTSSGRA
jgi:dTDP-4-amino-4,6-dideoxygalactose transaminase